MMVGFFLGARTASLRAAQHAGSFTLTTPGTAAWHVDGETVAPEPMPDGGTSLVLSAGEKEVLAETPDGARLRVPVGPAGVQQISLERTETEKSP